jgi:acyl-coenzyme A synthetase/AMP-(fatty) acid ligase
VRSALSEMLPTYMLPSRWKSFDSLPKNANGKIDRTRLRPNETPRVLPE